MKKILSVFLLLAIAAPIFCSCGKDSDDEIIENKPEPGVAEISVEGTRWVSDKMVEDFGRSLPAFFIEFEGKSKCMVYEYQSPGTDLPGYMVGSPLEYARTGNNLSIIEEYWDISSDPGKWAIREYATCTVTSDKELTFVYQAKSYHMTKTGNTD